MPKERPVIEPMPIGCEPFGTPRGDVNISAIMPSYIQPGTELAPPSHIAFDYGYEPCAATRTDGMPCTARRIAGGDKCRGHKIQDNRNAKKEALIAAETQTG